METILAILGLAVSIGGLIPFFTTEGTKIKIVVGVIALTLLGISLNSILNSRLDQRYVHHAKETILIKLQSHGAMTFEQLFSELNYASYDIASRAADELLDERRAHDKLLDVTSGAGKKYRVRVYNLPGSPIE